MKSSNEFKKSNEEMTDLYIYGDITSYKWDESDVGAYDFLKELNDVDTDNLTVHINSYGGSVSEGLAIHNMIKEFKGNVTTVCVFLHVQLQVSFLWQERKESCIKVHC